MAKTGLDHFNFQCLGFDTTSIAIDSAFSLSLDNIYQNLNFLPPLPIGLSVDQLLAKLRDMERELERLEAQRVFTLAEHVAILRRDAGWLGPLITRKFTSEEVLAIVDNSQSERSLYEFATVTFQSVLFAEHRRYVVTRLKRCVRFLIVSTYKIVSRFCGVSWFQRLWFLLHGSHPPKTEVVVIQSPILRVCLAEL